MNIKTTIGMLLSLTVGHVAFADDNQSSPSVTLETPHGGWNFSGLVDHSGDVGVNYPYSPIDRGHQRNRTLIKGAIRRAGKDRVPNLVVNGNPMPLRAGEDGRYERHYAFGVGSNNVEVKMADGKSVKRVQYYEANPNQVTPKMRIICSWDAPEAEVDLHILTPDRQHVSYSQAVMKDGGGLDLDSVDGPGPEMFTDATPQHGVYNVYINYWGNLNEFGYNFDQSQLKKPIITARVTLILNENTANEKRESFVVPLRKIGELMLVKSFVY
jgi:uncharacterized protein YfaP (DUF2135 family)